jgi:hypothetical protein
MPRKPPSPIHHQPRTENRFRERELARAVRAAKAAGGERVEIDPSSGRITVVIGSASKELGAAAWDEATAKLKRRR